MNNWAWAMSTPLNTQIERDVWDGTGQTVKRTADPSPGKPYGTWKRASGPGQGTTWKPAQEDLDATDWGTP